MIQIHKSPTADSRTCDVTQVSKDQLIDSSIQHIDDVRAALYFLGTALINAGAIHDRDKIDDIDSFYSNFRHKFEEGHTDWWERHKKLNRHHLSPQDGVIPDDVNLIDVLDYVADCVMAGMARSGSVRPLTISPEVLMRAFWNTAKLLEKEVEVIE